MFEHLVGSSMLTKNNTLESTSALLNDKDFVLLYFSASWCGPCRHFTPQLKQFYNYVNSNGHKVEVVFVSFDRDIHAFYEYYSTMPWLSIPLQPASSSSGKKNFISHLPSQFWVNAIPSLVVLTKDGLYVTNTAKSQISHVIGTRGDPSIVMESWKNIQHVPIDEAYLGIIPSIYSSFKNAYNYITGNGSSKTSSTTSEDGFQQKEKQKLIPPRMLLSFFEKTTRKLDVYPNIEVRGKLLVRYENESDDDRGRMNVPISLESQRMLLLNEQVQALKESVSEYNSSLKSCTADGICSIEGDNDDAITVEEVQCCLKLLGLEDFTMVDSTNETYDEILKLMSKMNISARMAFARSVLWSEVSWAKQYEEADDDGNTFSKDSKACEIKFPEKYSFIDFSQVHRTLLPLGDESKFSEEINVDRETILEYCGLLNTALTLPEVQQYLSSGKDVFQLDLDNDREHRTPEQQRIVCVQNMMLCAVGYDPILAGAKIGEQIITMKAHDEDVNKVLSTYLKNMQISAKNTV